MPENVTRPRSNAASDGPTPRTRSNPSSDPNAPFALRSSTMRRASTGPIRGSRSMSDSVATSRSTSGTGCADVSRNTALLEDTRIDALRRAVRETDLVESPAMAESAWVNRWPRGRRTLLVFAPPFRVASFVRAESTAASCRDSAWRVAASDDPSSRAARTTRTLAPRTMTPARNRRALRSAGVGMARRCRGVTSGLPSKSCAPFPFPA